MSNPDCITPTKTCTKCGATYPATPEFWHRNKAGTGGLDSRCKVCRVEAAIEYYRLCRDRLLEHKREVYAANPEKKLEQSRQWREANPEKIAKRYREYYEANPEKYATCKRNRRARKEAASGTHTAEDIQAQYARQRGKCYYCGEKVNENYHVDHVTPLAKGGSNGPENLVIACPSCNLSKGPKLPLDFCGRLL